MLMKRLIMLMISKKNTFLIEKYKNILSYINIVYISQFNTKTWEHYKDIFNCWYLWCENRPLRCFALSIEGAVRLCRLSNIQLKWTYHSPSVISGWSWLKLEIQASLCERAHNNNQQGMLLEIYKAPDDEKVSLKALMWFIEVNIHVTKLINNDGVILQLCVGY